MLSEITIYPYSKDTWQLLLNLNYYYWILLLPETKCDIRYIQSHPSLSSHPDRALPLTHLPRHYGKNQLIQPWQREFTKQITLTQHSQANVDSPWLPLVVRETRMVPASMM